tara:strand:+ start:1466 stop:3658 length:2193 start_codon:yes stop_codon:yes gene_type:complete
MISIGELQAHGFSLKGELTQHSINLMRKEKVNPQITKTINGLYGKQTNVLSSLKGNLISHLSEIKKIATGNISALSDVEKKLKRKEKEYNEIAKEIDTMVLEHGISFSKKGKKHEQSMTKLLSVGNEIKKLKQTIESLNAKQTVGYEGILNYVETATGVRPKSIEEAIKLMTDKVGNVSNLISSFNGEKKNLENIVSKHSSVLESNKSVLSRLLYHLGQIPDLKDQEGLSGSYTALSGAMESNTDGLQKKNKVISDYHTLLRDLAESRAMSISSEEQLVTEGRLLKGRIWAMNELKILNRQFNNIDGYIVFGLFSDDDMMDVLGKYMQTNINEDVDFQISDLFNTIVYGKNPQNIRFLLPELISGLDEKFITKYNGNQIIKMFNELMASQLVSDAEFEDNLRLNYDLATVISNYKKAFPSDDMIVDKGMAEEINKLVQLYNDKIMENGKTIRKAVVFMYFMAIFKFMVEAISTKSRYDGFLSDYSEIYPDFTVYPYYKYSEESIAYVLHSIQISGNRNKLLEFSFNRYHSLLEEKTKLIVEKDEVIQEKEQLILEKMDKIALLEGQIESRQYSDGGKKTKIETLKEQIATKKKKIGELQAHIKDLEEYISNIEKELKEVKKERDSLTTQLKNKVVEVETAKMERDTYRSEKTENSERLKLIQQEFLEFKEERDEKINDLKLELQTAKRDAERLRKENGLLRDEFSAYKGKNPIVRYWESPFDYTYDWITG